jgi:hypothetical protein
VNNRAPCTKEEFDAFIKAYPRPLVFDVTGICEPPYASYNDFTLGNWPESVVAGYSHFDDNEPYYKGSEHHWSIRKDLDLPTGSTP